jgi:C-terminal processing protease CtpA/Prc
VLVVRAPQDERLKLQDGDVILDIDGRLPTSVPHAVQILSSYPSGEKLKLHILRQQKRIELAVDVPEAPAGDGSEHGQHFGAETGNGPPPIFRQPGPPHAPDGAEQ